MNELSTRRPEHRATILLGWDELGREVLRRFLVTAALRDALKWETEGDGVLARKRRLAGLELFCLTDGAAGGGARGLAGLFGETDLELLADVEAQIRPLDAGGDEGEAVARAVVDGAKRLLAPEGGTGGSSRPPGLDLVVVAHPENREALGRLDAVTGRIFAELGRLGTLRWGVAGSEPVAAVALLDLDNEWDSAPAARVLRSTLAEIVGRFEQRRHRGELTFARVYLSGEMGRHHIRRPELRIDKLSLFLELMLFEGRHHDPLKRLFQPQPVQEPSLGTFGIRLFERNHGLLRQLAAARFGALWLRYLAGNVPADEEQPRPSLALRLASFHPARLDALSGWEEVRQRLAGELATLEKDLADLAPERSDWPQAVRACYELRAAALVSQLGESASRAAARLAEELGRFPEVLASGITAALCDGHRPLPMGSVVAELGPLNASTRTFPEPGATESPGPEPFWQRLGPLAARYRALAGEPLTAGRRRWLWALLALLVAVGWVTPMREALEDLPAAGPMAHPTYSWLISAGQGLAQPLPASLVLAAAASAFYFLLVGPAAERRLARSRRFFADRRQGRLIDVVRSGLAAGGALAAPLEAVAERFRRDLAVNAAKTVGREVDRAVRRLEELSREALWLAEQLERFLALYGLTVEGGEGSLELVRKDKTGIRQRAERATELASLLRTHPPEPALFRAVQAERWVLADWRQPGGSLFLYPLEFVERLSRRFQIQAWAGTSGALKSGEGPREELLAFFGQRGGASLAFDWRQQEGLSPAQHLAVLPRRWASLDGVCRQLSDVQIDAARTLTSLEDDRAYLVSLQLGLSPQLLREDP